MPCMSLKRRMRHFWWWVVYGDTVSRIRGRVRAIWRPFRPRMFHVEHSELWADPETNPTIPLPCSRCGQYECLGPASCPAILET